MSTGEAGRVGFNQTPAQGFDHPALLYHGPEDYLAGTVAFIEDGLAGGYPVMVAVPEANLGLIRQALGASADKITMYDMSRAGRNPGRIIPSVLLRFADAHAGSPVRIIGEPIWPGRDRMEYPACVQHEALINSVFEGRDAAVLCPYDVWGLNAAAIADAYRTHPIMVTGGERSDSTRYAHPFTVAADFNVPLPDPPDHAMRLALGRTPLSAVRRWVDQFATAAGLAGDRVADLTFAANELVGNTMAHADGIGLLSMWVEDGHVVCQIADGGHIHDPLAGRIPPSLTDATGGRGLLLVNQLCDLVRVYTRPGTTTIRIHVCR
jgi:anti-sigma regulatory factor (Ser/Thr protein kinase)